MWRLDNEQCEVTCERKHRIYVAISSKLNSCEGSNGRPWQGLYVFKVGTTKACCDRHFSIRCISSNGKPRKQVAYAGGDDWDLLRCWDVLGPQADVRLFLPWARNHIRWIDPVVCDASGRKRRELYCLTGDQVTRDVWPGTGDELNDDIVGYAIKGFRLRIAEGKIHHLAIA